MYQKNLPNSQQSSHHFLSKEAQLFMFNNWIGRRCRANLFDSGIVGRVESCCCEGGKWEDFNGSWGIFWKFI